MALNAINTIQEGIRTIDEATANIKYPIKSSSIYYAVAEIFELYRLRLKNRIRSLYSSPRKNAVSDFINGLKKKSGKEQNLEIRKTPFQFEYILHYRCEFPVSMKPAEDIVVSENRPLNAPVEDLQQILDIANCSDGSNNAACALFWNIPEWRGVADLSFLNERQFKLITTIMKSICDEARMQLWESLKFGCELQQTLMAMDKCFECPIKIVNRPVIYGSWLRDIAVNEKW